MSVPKASQTTCGLLSERLQTIPFVMRSTSADAMARSVAPSAALQWDVVGVGGSEGPARLMVEVINHRGGRARHLPVSSFLVPSRARNRERGLVVFSQGLSPHARMVLGRTEAYERCIVISTRLPAEVQSCMSPACAEVTVINHLPQEEPRSLVRVVGPTAAAVVAVWTAFDLTGASALERAQLNLGMQAAVKWYESISASDPWRGALDHGELAFCLAAAQDLPAAHQLMWKWQETIYQPLPPALDLLAFIHGPFQSIYDRPACLLALRSTAGPAVDQAWTALENVLHPDRHRLVELQSPVSFPLSYFYFDALVLGILVQAVAQRGLRLDCWPGQGKDRVLYELSPFSAESTSAVDPTGRDSTPV